MVIAMASEAVMKRGAAMLAALALAGCAAWFGGEPPAKVTDGVFVEPAKGMTLYTFDRDTPTKSACVAQCAVNWPPLVAPADAKAAGNWTVVTRDDGRRQWAYKGKPLYTWARDQQPGDRTGDGFNNLWRVAKP
jgi:predicted lipoprotein with Yx(FWY)xxD motif